MGAGCCSGTQENFFREKSFNAFNNVRGWWPEEIEGGTGKLNDVFNYHYEDVHRCKIKIIEFIPNEK